MLQIRPDGDYSHKVNLFAGVNDSPEENQSWCEKVTALDEYLAMIVHEVRNPLTTIAMGLQYAQKVLPADAERERVELALSEAHRVTRLLHELLDYAKPQTFRLSKVRIGALLDEVLMQIRGLPEAAERHLVLANDFPGCEIVGDAGKLKQVLLNVLRNALEATTPHETVNISVFKEENLAQVCIKIHNAGEPIPPEILSSISRPFFSTKPLGTGLGLAVSKRIVDAHGGKLHIISATAGTTVSVHLPLNSQR
jgi:signal transduction histidine kinase